METKPFFAPMLTINSGVTDIDFYKKAFNAVELRRFSNDDGSVHVAEFTIDGALFHLHEQTERNNRVSPDEHGGTTVVIGLMVNDVHGVVEQAVAAGAKVISPVQDYDYGYRQGDIVDPFGHQWQIQKVIP
jgi:PhnB protein